MQNIPGNDNISPASIQVNGISLQELSRLLGGAAASFGRIPTQPVENEESDPDYVDEEEEEDDNEDYDQYHGAAHQWFPAVTEPQEDGLNLLINGEFGRVGQRLETIRNNINVTKLLRDRGRMARPSNYKEDIASVSLSTYLPTFL
jgi:WD repeat-containing protein 23